MDFKEKYKLYLQSNDWKQKKKSKLSKNKNCAICNSKENLDIHHIFYKNWYDVENSDLRILCRKCHFTCHDLMKDGTITFKEGVSHHSKFATIKHYVKKHLGYGIENMFYK